MKNDSGLTNLGTLIIICSIIIIIILAVRFINLQYMNEEIETIKTNMLLVQGKAKIILEEKNALKSELKGINASEKREDENIKKILEANVIGEDNIKDWYLFNEETLNEIGLDFVYTEEGVYIVNYSKQDVIYLLGANSDEKTIYKLSDLTTKIKK